MKSRDAILIALLVVLALVLIYKGGAWLELRQVCGAGASPRRTARAPAALQARASRAPRAPPAAPHAAAAPVEQAAEDERDEWFAGVAADGAGAFDAETAHDPGADALHYHRPAPPLDYGSHIAGEVADSRTQENHRRWVEEMRPWSGAARSGGDFAPGDNVDFVGLRRPQPVHQGASAQVTELDASDLAHNPRFDFRG